MSFLLTVLTAGCLSGPVTDAGMDEIGSARYKKAMFKLYDASLCSKSDSFEWDEPFALTLDYLRDFSSEMITDAGIHEMARFTGKEKTDFVELRPTLLKCFPDVDKGDQIVGFSEGPNTARFYHNGELACEVEWPEFRENFFGIWLGEETRAPRKAGLLKGL